MKARLRKYAAITVIRFRRYIKNTLIGITEMEKLMGKKQFRELLGEYIIKPKGKLTLVPETDKREEVHTLGDFDEIPLF